MSYPPTQPLTPEEKDLVWKFRFYLTRDKRVNIQYKMKDESSFLYYLFIGLDQIFKMCALDRYYRS